MPAVAAVNAVAVVSAPTLHISVKRLQRVPITVNRSTTTTKVAASDAIVAVPSRATAGAAAVAVSAGAAVAEAERVEHVEAPVVLLDPDVVARHLQRSHDAGEETVHQQVKPRLVLEHIVARGRDRLAQPVVVIRNR